MNGTAECECKKDRERMMRHSAMIGRQGDGDEWCSMACVQEGQRNLPSLLIDFVVIMVNVNW